MGQYKMMEHEQSHGEGDTDIPMSLSNSALLSMMDPAVTAKPAVPVIQRVPALWEIALVQAKNRAMEIQGFPPSLDYKEAMRNWRGLGFSRNIFGLRLITESNSEAYFENCIKKYYGKDTSGRVSWRNFRGDGLGSDKAVFMAAHGSQKENSLLGSQLNSAINIFDATSSGYFPSLQTALNTVLFSGIYPFSPLAPAQPGPSFSTTGLAGNNSQSLVTTAAEGIDIAKKMMRPDHALPPVALSPAAANVQGSFQSRFDFPGNAADTLLYFVNPGLPPSHTNRRTFTHELAHQEEAYLGVEDKVRLFRGLYARTKNIYDNGYDGTQIPEKGIGKTGSDARNVHKYGLNLYLPETTAAFRLKHAQAGRIPPDHPDKQTNLSQRLGYAGTLTSYPAIPPAHPGGAHYPVRRLSSTFATEFLSTTAEFLEDENNAHILINTDPMRVALFLKLTNPNLYRDVKTNFETANPGVNLNILLHAD